MFCRKCGNQINDHAAFCTACGTKTILEMQQQQAYEASAQQGYAKAEQLSSPSQYAYYPPQTPYNNVSIRQKKPIRKLPFIIGGVVVVVVSVTVLLCFLLLGNGDKNGEDKLLGSWHYEEIKSYNAGETYRYELEIQFEDDGVCYFKTTDHYDNYTDSTDAGTYKYKVYDDKIDFVMEDSEEYSRAFTYSYKLNDDTLTLTPYKSELNGEVRYAEYGVDYDDSDIMILERIID